MLQRPSVREDLHYGNLPIFQVKHKDLTLQGYSRAAVQTYWNLKEAKITFDCGGNSWDLASCPRLALTHAHADHIAGLASYIATRNILRLEQPKVFVPSTIAPGVEKLLLAWSELTGDAHRIELVPCSPGEQLALGNSWFLEAFSTVHPVPSQGYFMVQRRHKLLEQYQNTSQDEIVKLKQQGVTVTVACDYDQFAFTGDTTIKAFDLNPRLYSCKMLVMEVSFITADTPPEHAARYGHIHLDDVLERADLFENEVLVFGHFSTRYSTEQIVKVLEERLPERLRERVVIWV